MLKFGGLHPAQSLRDVLGRVVRSGWQPHLATARTLSFQQARHLEDLLEDLLICWILRIFVGHVEDILEMRPANGGCLVLLRIMV